MEILRNASTLEILPVSTISEMARRATLPALEILYPLVDPRGQSARTLTADKLAAPISPLVFVDSAAVRTRSHHHHSEAK